MRNSNNLSGTRIILGIDPGYADLGYGLISVAGQRMTYITCDSMRTKSSEPQAERLATLFHELQKIITSYKPQLMSVEKIFFTNNQKTAIDVAHARGVMLLAAALNNLPVAEYTPLEVKQSLTSSGRAQKLQVARMVYTLLNISTLKKKDDAIDAL